MRHHLVLQVDELGDLAIGRLVLGEGVQPGCGLPLQQFVPGDCHPKRAHCRVAPEDCRVPSLLRAVARRRGQNPTVRQIALQELNRPFVAGIQQ